MEESMGRLIEIVEDHTSMELAMRMVMEAAETKELPNEGSLPCFNDGIIEENFIALLEKVTGKEY